MQAFFTSSGFVVMLHLGHSPVWYIGLSSGGFDRANLTFPASIPAKISWGVWWVVYFGHGLHFVSDTFPNLEVHHLCESASRCRSP